MSTALLDLIDRALARTREAGASAADVVAVESEGLDARVREREIDFVSEARERTLGIRAFVATPRGSSVAITSTRDFSPEAIDRMAAETVRLARATAPDPAAGLPDEPLATGVDDLGLFDPADRAVTVDARIEDARRAEAAARAVDPRVVSGEGSQVSSSHRFVAYGSSAGFRGHYESATHGLFCEPIARENGAMQRDYWMTASRRLADLEAPDAVGRRAGERAIRRLHARRVRTGEYPVIFDPLTARSLLGHLAGCLSGYAIYRESSFLASKLGQPIASEQVSVLDDGRLPGGLGSRPFDGEGLATRRNTLVSRGVLKSWMLDSYSGRKLGLPSTGNATRSAASAPGVGATNLWLEPGTLSLDELIERTPRGLLVTELIGQGFHPVTGDYSRGAAGIWIEDGRLAHAVEEITIAGHLGEMLAAIDLVGSDLLWLGATASPSLRVARMTIAGD